jgi:hypothetical protein
VKLSLFLSLCQTPRNTTMLYSGTFRIQEVMYVANTPRSWLLTDLLPALSRTARQDWRARGTLTESDSAFELRGNVIGRPLQSERAPSSGCEAISALVS